MEKIAEARTDSRDPGTSIGGVGMNDLKTRIASTYINRQLEAFLLRHGNIPEVPSESCIGVGFVDIVDYSYLSAWLSPLENQRFLNGLYTAFSLVLKKRGGYLNKISGDSLMFHFGGKIDPMVSDMRPDEAEPLIARLLFLTCIEIQESCRLFNRADEDFIPANIDAESRNDLVQAFTIIRTLRENLALVSSISNLFQVRVRIGAAIGDVCIGNFGPEGAKQWDVVGVPVIEARRMEASAPVDGIRMTKRLSEVLEHTGLFQQYLSYFRGKASGFYQAIAIEELFAFRQVVLVDKRRASFESCVVQANPDLPEDIWRFVEGALESGVSGIETIIGVLTYHRGNRLIIEAIEELFKERGIALRKARMYKFLVPGLYAKLVRRSGGSEAEADARIERKTTLYHLFGLLGKLQDALKANVADCKEEIPFAHWDAWADERISCLKRAHEEVRLKQDHCRYFLEVLFPGFFAMLEASLREYFSAMESSARLSGT
jgi:adenylate cyclase